MILLFATQNNFVGKILSFKILNFIGLISYSLYLWHQPVLALMKKQYTVHLEPIHLVTSLTIIFLLSYFTWKYIENPFRNRQRFKQNKIFKLSILSILAISLCGLLFKESLHIRKIFSPTLMERYEAMLEADSSHSNQVIYNSNCKFWSQEFNSSFIDKFEKCANLHSKAVFIIGGSHGIDLYNAIAMNAPNKFIVSISRGYCRAHEFVDENTIEPNCQYEDFKKFAKIYSDNISYLLYTQTPDSLFDVQPFNEASEDNLSIKRVDEVVGYLSEIKNEFDLNVVMIGMLPLLLKSPIDWNYTQTIEEQFDNIITEESVSLTKYVDSIFASKLEKYEIVYISKLEGFQLEIRADLLTDGHITYSDRRHISYHGEKLFGSRLISYLSSNGYIDFYNID